MTGAERLAGPSLAGGVAVVSGAGDGIGRACALALAADGADVVLGARTLDRLTALCAEVTATTGRAAVAVRCDITDPDQARALADTAAERFGRLDAVVNVAALSGGRHKIEQLADEDLRAAFEVNVVGTLAVCRAALPHLRASGGGAITQISTLSTRSTLPGLAAYAATKQALVSASRTLALEVGRDGIRVNVVVPGYTRGAPLDRLFERMAEARGTDATAIEAEIVASTALRRIPSAHDIAEAVLYLASPRAACVTGVSIDVNGGQWLP
ncbi:SDR family oxidoreductase [soil metagenome]